MRGTRNDTGEGTVFDVGDWDRIRRFRSIPRGRRIPDTGRRTCSRLMNQSTSAGHRPEQSPVSETTVVEAIRNQRRRYVLYYL